VEGEEADELLDDIVMPSFSVSVDSKLRSSESDEKKEVAEKPAEKPVEKKATPSPKKKGFVVPKKATPNKSKEEGESPAKRARKSASPKKEEKPKTEKKEKKTEEKKPAKKRSRTSRKSKGYDDDDDDKKSIEESQMSMVADDGDEDEEDDDEEDEEDPEDEDVEGKGYKLVVALTSVPQESRKAIVKEIKSHQGHLTRELGLATHVVCAMPQRTIKLMCAILKGLWVLSSSWVTDSKSKSEMLPEEQYELKNYPGIRESRLKHAESGFLPLFHDQKFVIGHTIQTNPQKKEIAELVAAGGGKSLLLKEVDQADFFIAAPGKAVPSSLPDHVKVISQSEFFDAISNYVPLVPNTSEEKKKPDDRKKQEKAEEAPKEVAKEPPAEEGNDVLADL